MFLMGLLYAAFIMLMLCCFCSQSTEDLYMKRGILSNAFSASADIVVWFLSFIFLVWSVMLIDLHPWYHRDESPWVTVYCLFYVFLNSVCKYFVENFCIYIYHEYWSIVFLLGCPYLVYQGSAGLVEKVWRYSLLNFLEVFKNDLH